MHWDRQTKDEIRILENAILCMDTARDWLDFWPGNNERHEKSGAKTMSKRLAENMEGLAKLRSILPQGRLYQELKRSKAIIEDITFAARRLEEICTETGNPTDARAHEKLMQVLRRLEEF
jgi:hypothetical protein